MAQTQISNSSNTLAVVLGTNQIVERCFAKMANDVTLQVRDKLIDIVLAVVARESEDFDVESVRRLILAEIPDPTVTIEKRVKTQDPDTKTKTKTQKTVELDADGNPVKRARKEKAPKAPKVTLSEDEKAALKAEKEAAKSVAKEAAKAAKQIEREAAKAAKAQADAEKPAKEPKVKAPKEARLPIPWCGVAIESRCHALRSYHGLFAQCVSDKTETGEFCAACEKAGAPFGTVAMRMACGVFDYTAPNGKKCVRLANVIDKFGFAEGGEQAFQEEAAKHNITIPYEHLEKEVKQRGRPKSSSPRARPATAAKIATSDTGSGSGSETETDDEEYQAKQQQQQRKKVTKTAAAAATDAAPKKRGRPAKAKEAAPEPKDDLIQGLVASAKKAATPRAKSAPTSPELSEDEVTPVAVVVAIAKPKLAAKPKAKAAVAKPKAPERNVIEMDGDNYWVEECSGEKVLVRCSDNYAFNLSGEGLGVWDNKTKTIIEDEDEESSCDEE
jgi:histone H1/5